MYKHTVCVIVLWRLMCCKIVIMVFYGYIVAVKRKRCVFAILVHVKEGLSQLRVLFQTPHEAEDAGVLAI